MILFIKILNMSLVSSFVISIILVIRFLFKRAPKQYSYYLWFIALFRLLIPFSFEGFFSIIPVNTNTIPLEIEFMFRPQINAGISQLDTVVNNALKFAIPRAHTMASMNPIQPILYLLNFLWIAGVCTLVVYSIISYFRVYRLTLTATLIKDNIFESDRISGPFVFGLLRPRIYISGKINKHGLKYVIAHEKTHIKRYDNLLKTVYFIGVIIHWFNPLVWLSYKLLIKDIEMSCDELVMSESGSDIRRSYAQSLLTLSTERNATLSPLAFGENALTSRIKNIVAFKKPRKVMIILCIAICIVQIPLLLVNPLGTTSVRYHPDFPLSNMHMIIHSVEVGDNNSNQYRLSKDERNEMLDFIEGVIISKKPINDSRRQTRPSDYSIKLYRYDKDTIPMLTLHLDKNLTQIWADNNVKPTKSYKIKRLDIDSFTNILIPKE